jgi:hypothetical protein
MKSAINRRSGHGIRIALTLYVFDRLVRAIVMLVPATTCAARLHSHSIAPVDATQELTRCLRTIRLVVARREHKRTISFNDRTTSL